ncbi:MAG: hypothetical protein SFU56_14315 [Capsulimonadales bacterium]|nr:hypothetical protein [Capsulimonadales bacterium]
MKPIFAVPFLVLSAIGVPAAYGRNPPTFTPPPGVWRTSWVGNSFGGDGGPNGEGFWIQNAADEIDVSPDGTVFAAIDGDEAGRCLGLYKEGRPGRILVKAKGEGLANSAWGWGTGGHAIAVHGSRVYAATTGKKLLRFTWKPGDTDSVVYDTHVETGVQAVGLAATADRLAVVYPNEIELRRADDLSVLRSLPITGAKDVVIAPDNSLWVLAGTAIRHLSDTGQPLGELADVGTPTALAWDHRGRLLVCDDGRRQQVLIYDVAGAPKRVATFGTEGGLRAGTPGAWRPDKLFSLRGAGTDAQGNLYVAMSFGTGPVGNLFLRSFKPTGELRWERYNTAFVDTFGFDPGTDGRTVFSRTAIFDLDLDRRISGREQTCVAVTLDHIAYPNDERIKGPASVLVRRVQGKTLVAMIGQYGGGYRLYTFEKPGSRILREVARIGPPEKTEAWAWNLTQDGDIWYGDAPGRTMRVYRFRGWDGETPRYDREKPEEFLWPDDFELVRRVLYDPAADRLYVFGYLKGQAIDSWGVAGKTCRRYDGWRAGKRVARWTIALPVNPTGENGKPLTPEGVDIAGDYLFVGMVKPEDGKQYTHIYRLSDGGYVGSFYPGPEVGGQAGWQDMPYSVQAWKRRNGEYLVLVEEDFRGKNLLYRWTPGS